MTILNRDVEDMSITIRLRDKDRDEGDKTLGFQPGRKICTPFLLQKTNAILKITDDGDEMEPYKPEMPVVEHKTGGAPLLTMHVPPPPRTPPPS